MKAIKGKNMKKRSARDHCLMCEEDHPTRYYALQAKDGHLATSITGMVLVCTHKLKQKGYKCVELIVKK